MTLRTICFVGAVVAQGWLRWTFVVGALVLPYVAVLIANAGRESGGRHGDRVLPPIPAPPARELPAAAPRAAYRGEARHSEDVPDSDIRDTDTRESADGRAAEAMGKPRADEPAGAPEHRTPPPPATHAA
jgi:hypothetical protein